MTCNGDEMENAERAKQEPKEPRFKCSDCLLILKESELNGDKCPECGKKVGKMCESDHICTCIDDISAGTQVCKICKEFVCPCGSHDCSPQSRITGYIGAISAWNSGKRIEFLDRVRYDPMTGGFASRGALYSEMGGGMK
jgi:hypothetical protein